ncbi:hypothetical protein GGQ22_05050 [Nocardioides sp. zg-579]|uniref:Uncharacterized protein n=1 Tax=Nocardioides marmotae TaxID=2663857 RepID=A0A6I3J5E0_9ACTN|nr:MXAN_6640 family putative metalloprotease [Nocardioides marmotae]MCR6030807.1 hypothetical protein [Gordonia jinghuaiqii]MTB94442.1 hypothetical protein [Nocardioides marmotae]QKE01536.1 hypothetical protein HPC71_10945 [Nocardioides marmotae]
MRKRPTTGLLAAGLALTVTASLGAALASPATAGPGPASQTSAAAKAGTAAKAALAEAEAAVTGTAGASATEGRNLTLVLRDLLLAKDTLRGQDRADAESLLLRPTTPPDDPSDPRDIYYGADADLRTQCTATFCLHWVEEGEHATTPAFAATAFETIRHVAGVYAAAGFRAPLPDAGQEGDTRTDFYLGDIDAYGALGFCRSDADGPVVGSAWYAYCGFDNDYASSPWLDPTSLLRITVAHEYFHAVQFAYDAEDDGWLMESTATAMEDELYDAVNDNASFLGYGQLGDPAASGYPLAGPATPLDTFDFTAYGNWIFWRYLTEQHPDETAGVPNLVREVWEALDTTRRPNPTSSLQALEKVLRARGTSTPQEYVAFADANQHPWDVYEEAVEQRYPTAPDTLAAATLARNAPHATRTAVLDHLTSATGSVVPFAGSRNLKVRVDLGDATAGRAAVTVHRAGGATTTTYVATNKQGKGDVTVPFAAGTVSRVEVTLANGGVADAMTAEVRYQAVG